jgi:type II secretory pathway pseudopilin PulG
MSSLDIEGEPEQIRQYAESEFERMIKLGLTLIEVGIAITVAGIVGSIVLSAIFGPK